MSLQSVVERRRKELRMSQNALAVEAGMDRAQLSRILSGEENPKLTRLEAIAKALQMPMWRLLLEASDPDAMQQSAWNAIFEQMDPERREHAIRWLSHTPAERQKLK